MSTLLRIEDLYRIYQVGTEEVHALDGVSLTIEDNEYVAIMGPSGSGKSTLMNVIGCLDTPSRGHYYLKGKEVSQLSDDELARVRNQEIGFVFQTFNLLARADALHTVELPLIYSGIAPAERRQMARDALIAVGLEDRIRHRPNELSGGQRQRVAVARALVNQPALLLADEPTGNLDPKTADQVLDLLLEMNRLHGTALVVVTHSPDIASRLGRRVVLVDGYLEEIAASEPTA